MNTNITTIQNPPTGSPSPIPSDLHDWLATDHLIHLAKEAVETFYWSTKTGAANDGIARQHARQLLTLLTYCYASGNYLSDSIAGQINSNGAFRYLCLNDCLDGERLRLFRGQNSELLKRCLAHVLNLASGGNRRNTFLRTAGCCGRDSVAFKFLCYREADRRVREGVLLDRLSAGSLG